ncbi:MAG: class I SAM-dependent methyltransferase, partial [Alphaproteobacteria bacterium]|nr:class I SAM-dependent methyltransferase [Alphaproteobacteria bacterium]
MAKKDDDIVFEKDNTIEYIEERNYLLKDIPYETVRRAWFTLSHLLLDDGARVLDMGCADGILTYSMAVLNPKVRFIGIDKSKRTINKAKEQYKLHNLEFKIGDVSSNLFKAESVDCIINNFILHRVFSDSRYNEQIVSDTLRKQFTMLKNDGIMYIRDYTKPPQDQYVLMEMHDDESKSDDLADLSEADLLVWYAEHAQPKQDPGCGGFFLEELPPRFPKTRLFRLPYKWAYEFIMRKDRRKQWKEELPYEFTFFTVEEFRQELKSLGARVEYSAPYWDEDFIRQHFLGHFRLLQTNGEPLGDPPTSFISLCRKEPERTSLRIMERRIAPKESQLKIKTLRDEHSGKAADVVSREEELSEILPYLLDEDGRLYIYLHDGIARGLVNAVSRSGSNIDERQWSGHMVEALALDYKDIYEIGEFTEKNSKAFAKNFFNMTLEKGAILEAGPNYYPEPNYIDERVHTHYLHVKDAGKSVMLKSKLLRNHHFHAKGIMRKFSAQTVLDAIAVGLIPNARLELQI